ncbi:MAG: hypothetical protein JNN20_07375 [Betaproteobacteria bacterium]|nr:hypothetical protein [Betaproteobacteria bacterium]
MKYHITSTALALSFIAIQPFADAQEKPATRVGGCIEGTVEVSAAVPTETLKGATLFVYVREVGRDRGPPSAVKTIKDPAYPFSFKLCQSDQMIPTSPGRPLDGTYRVYARHSLTGAPMTEEGWIGSSAGDRDLGVRAGTKVTVVVSTLLGSAKK